MPNKAKDYIDMSMTAVENIKSNLQQAETMAEKAENKEKSALENAQDIFEQSKQAKNNMLTLAAQPGLCRQNFLESKSANFTIKARLTCKYAYKGNSNIIAFGGNAVFGVRNLQRKQRAPACPFYAGQF